jgi:hypothetical protein
MCHERYVSECLKYDVMNQSYVVFGRLNIARAYAGALKTKNFCLVFNGYARRNLNSIERFDFNKDKDFEIIECKNSRLLGPEDLMAFSSHNEILILGLN